MAPLINSCMLLLLQMDMVVMHRNFRQKNEVAHILTKQAGTLLAFNKVNLLLLAPPFVMTRMLTDKGGHVFIKTIFIITSSQLAGICN